MELVTMFCPLTLAGVAETLFQVTGGDKSVVDCNMNPRALAGQVNMSFSPVRIRVNFGWDGLEIRALILVARRKNICGPDVKLVAIYCPLTTVDADKKGLQTTGGDRLVVYCNA